jgi:hypothetical protein
MFYLISLRTEMTNARPPQDSPSLPLKLNRAVSTDEGVWTSCYESGSASTPSTEEKLDDNTNSISSCVNVSSSPHGRYVMKDDPLCF